MRILIEASGSLTSGYLIGAIQAAGYQAVASDISSEVAGHYLADDFVVFPKASEPGLWEATADILRQHAIDVVLPSLDETLLGWAERRAAFAADCGCKIIVSAPEVVAIFQDKWETSRFFQQHDIPCPASSLAQDYPLVKPRFGRGGQGVSVPEQAVDMDGMISQELLTGTEYTIDILCDAAGEPVYIVPRKRLSVRDGKSTGGVVELHPGIIDQVRRLCAVVKFAGPINAQCFVSNSGEISFVEVNTRIAGGMALGFAATENWLPLLVDHFVAGKAIAPKPTQDGVRMLRYYAEVFVS